MKKYIILTFIIGLFSVSALAQNVLFSDNAENAYEIPRKGRNRAAFSHLYSGWRMAPAYFQNSDVNVWNGEFFVGRRAKYALSKNYAMGWALEYQHTTVSWNRDYSSIVSFDADKHKYLSNAVLLSYFNRITFGKVGDNIGKFMDISIYGAWNFKSKSVFSYDEGDKNHYEMTMDNPEFDDTFYYGLKARLGIHRVAITADYRLVTPDFKAIGSLDITRPQLTIGVELSLYAPKT